MGLAERKETGVLILFSFRGMKTKNTNWLKNVKPGSSKRGTEKLIGQRLRQLGF